jgi:hypothetical protein
MGIVTKPPLMPELIHEELYNGRSNDFTGSACESLTTGWLKLLSRNVAMPDVDQGEDVWIEMNDEIVKAQVKKVVYKPTEKRYKFNFQNTARTLTPKQIKYFYHIFVTPHRFMMWEFPSSIINLTEEGTFVESATVTLDKQIETSTDTYIDYRKYLIVEMYSPYLIKKNKHFFFPPFEDYVE